MLHPLLQRQLNRCRLRPGELPTSLEAWAALLDEAPDTYHVTEYYQRHPVVLARLARLDANALRDLLHLYRPIDGGEYLTCPHPLAWLDKYADDLAAFTGNADRHLAPRAQCPGG